MTLAKYLSAVFVVAFLAFAPHASAADAPRLNVVLILVDDMGYECIGANGGTSYPTPNIDRLAAAGTRFEHCYVQPLCTPTRAQLMTGQYNVRNYVRFGLLDRDQVTFAQLFRKAGYKTCIAGKWQLSGGFDAPNHFGFDEYCLWQLTRRPERYRNPGLEINGKQVNFTKGEYGPDIVNDYACDFISRSKDKPFLLYYPMMLTHAPFDATPDSTDYGGGKAGTMGRRRSQTARHFRDMVVYTDKLVGKLVAKLESEGIADRTLILFVGDNGTGRGIESRMGRRAVAGGKGSADDGGMHVPLIVKGPGVSARQVTQDLVDSTDFLPTICAAAGVAPPADLTLDGHSFWPQCHGQPGTREWIYSWYARDGGPTADTEFVRDHQFKLMRSGKLFDVRKGDLGRKPIKRSELDEAGRQAVAKLQAALDRFKDARPEKLRTATAEPPVSE